jgi:hypothetical protein
MLTASRRDLNVGAALRSLLPMVLINMPLQHLSGTKELAVEIRDPCWRKNVGQRLIACPGHDSGLSCTAAERPPHEPNRRARMSYISQVGLRVAVLSYHTQQIMYKRSLHRALECSYVQRTGEA